MQFARIHLLVELATNWLMCAENTHSTPGKGAPLPGARSKGAGLLVRSRRNLSFGFFKKASRKRVLKEKQLGLFASLLAACLGIAKHATLAIHWKSQASCSLGLFCLASLPPLPTTTAADIRTSLSARCNLLTALYSYGIILLEIYSFSSDQQAP